MAGATPSTGRVHRCDRGPRDRRRAHRKGFAITVPTLTQLSERVIAFPTGHSNTYLWRHGDHATVIDTGEVGCDAVVVEVLRHLGLGERDLLRIVLTHWHHDHTGGAAALAARTGARVHAGRADSPVIAGRRAGEPPALTAAEEPVMARISGLVAAAPPCPVDRELDDGDVLDDPRGPDLARIVATPGHTPGSVAIHLPAERVVLTGDIAARPHDGVILGLFNTDREQAAQSLRRLAGLDVDAAGFGHGDPVVAGASAALAAWTDPHG